MVQRKSNNHGTRKKFLTIFICVALFVACGIGVMYWNAFSRASEATSAAEVLQTTVEKKTLKLENITAGSNRLKQESRPLKTPSGFNNSHHLRSPLNSRNTTATQSPSVKLQNVSQPSSLKTWNISTTKSVPVKPKSILLSKKKPVTSDVVGNLGPPSVVTDESASDWLDDRWQAAKNMQGHPIPGSHWLEIDLQRQCFVTRVLVDWEDAYSRDWAVLGRKTLLKIKQPDTVGSNYQDNSSLDPGWVTLIDTNVLKQNLVVYTSPQHRIHNVTISPTAPHANTSFRYIRLFIRSPSTRWGASVWRFQVWGYEDKKV